MGRATANPFWPRPLGPGEGQISFNFNYKVNFKDFYTKLCICSHKTYQMGFSFCYLGHALGVGLCGAGGAEGVNIFFFKHGHVAFQIDEETTVRIECK